MLVMRRREGEAILSGDRVEIRILSINGSRVKIGISAPRDIPVQAREIELVRSENQAAAQTCTQDTAGLAAMLRRRSLQTSPEISLGMANKESGV